MKIENLDAKMEARTFEFEDQPEGDDSTLHERRIEVNDVNEKGIFFMCHDDDNNPCHVVFSAADARHLAAELLEAADDLDRILATPDELKAVLSKADRVTIDQLMAYMSSVKDGCDE